MQTAKVLSIAGSDSGGGAGIQADIKTGQELGVYTTTAITALTAQNTLGVEDVFPIPPSFLAQQLHAVLADIGTDVIKTGMLVSDEHIRVVCEVIDKYQVKQVVVDPVMASTSGSGLLNDSGMQQLTQTLLPRTTIFTPNIPEALRITNRETPKTIADLKEIAVQLHQLGPSVVVLKGGHFEGDAIDVYYDGTLVELLSHERIESNDTHGTGCTFASAIAAELAKGQTALEAVKLGKAFITEAIRHGLKIGSGKGPTNHAAYNQHR
ncbi:bifunctional hydroxymethylpyrimidine kinase/phosphomethylpyrimidine kinase [Shouchella sp. JSM 1781072]|uniref:bifunctional hydroxymethylpyrimidine kinase/phosphomethylpyrimidine kinase n=1 Tax=Bacillaceae TaxID=186817 RepID=UPI000C06DD64|nr:MULTISPECIES: bifunctional hydroxymethylpyrimidine kinase/phosphomethylpyrimidine kinase [Bacillaceae]UTR07997.1 bifunctional hydroxymethylpyrimidine kinase/phosphomethylpyrimidine kinase [Alkalihalobacillus sp. LMS6]